MASNDGIVNNTESCNSDEEEIDKVDYVDLDIISGEEVSVAHIAEKDPAGNVYENPVASASADNDSSLNMTGKKYDYGLKQIKDDPPSKNKPNEALTEGCNLIMMAPMKESFNVFQISSPVNNTPRDPKEDGSNIAVAGKGSVKLGQTGGDNDNSSDEPVIHVPLREDVELKQEEFVTTPTKLVRENLSEEELKIQELCKKFRGILNKLTPQKFDRLVKKALELEMDSQKGLECIIDLIYEKALAKPYFSETYAKISLKLSQLRVPSDNNSDREVSFRGLIIGKCQTEFETRKSNEKLIQVEKESTETAEPAKKKELQMMINKEKKKIRFRTIANIRFIGELYKLNMLTYKIMDYCIKSLIDQVEEENLECLCELLTTIGEKAENDSKAQLDSYFKKMEEIVKSKSNNISSRVKSKIQDTIDLRRKWPVKSDVEYQPKMMDQIQKEAERLRPMKLKSQTEPKPSFNPISRPGSNTFSPTVPKGGLGGVRNYTPKVFKKDGANLAVAGKGSVKLGRTGGGSNVSHKPGTHASLSSHDGSERSEDVKLKPVDSVCNLTSLVQENPHKEQLRTQGIHTTNLNNHNFELSNTIKENITIQPCSIKESLNTEKIKNMCVRLVTTHGRPFSMIEDAAFQEIVNIAVPSNAMCREINSNIIKGMIPEKAYQIRSKIGADVRNKMVSLILNAVTYEDRKFLGISLQYIEKGKIVIRNLAILEVTEMQTLLPIKPLKKKILEVLADFTITSSQIYSITTDNGCNNFKKTKLCQHGSETGTDDDIDEEISCDENEQSADEEHINYAEEELNVENIASALSNGEFKPRAIFYVANSLQLAVEDAIGCNETVQKTIKTARQAVMFLRRPNWKKLLRSSNLMKPILDCPTRWTSTYQMLLRLHSCKGLFGEHHELSLYTEEFWTDILDIITCLMPLNEATAALQRDHLTISDFYIEWLNCRTKVETIRTTFARDLVKLMKQRERILMDKDCVLEILYLDGRINIMLSDQECIKAKSLLCQTFRQLEIIESSDAGTSKMNIPNTIHDYDLSDAHNDLERLLQQTEKMRRLPQSIRENIFEESLNKLRFEPRLPLSKSIIAHWNSNDASLISLQKVANCVLAAPATQVSVKQLFSSVKYILNPLRTDIGVSLLQDIVLIRANHDLFE